MRSRCTFVLWTSATLLLAAVWAGSSTPSEIEALRARVEGIRDGSQSTVRGETIAARALLPAFYASRGFERAFGDPARAAALLEAIRASSKDGLNPEDYHLHALEAASESGPSEDLDLDLLRTDALIRLGYHVLFGKVDPTTFDASWNYERVIPGFDPVREIEAALAAPDLAARIESEKPSHPLYARLKSALERYRAIRDAGGWPRIPPGSTLRPGSTDARVPALRRRLSVSGDLPPDGGADASEVYDDVLVAAVRRFQARHGLGDDGIVGARSLEEMNVPVETRIEQIVVNLERGRWLLHDVGGTFVVVNVAGYRLYYVDEGALAWETRVQVGKPQRATPVFRSDITYLVFNPTWTVPPSILKKDILPSQRRDPTTLERKGLKVIDASGKEVPASSVNWSGSSFPYMLRQDPGPTNALGRVKFMFPNPYSVYLHDTPSKNLFDADDRAFSSGCIRVEDPLSLAERLLAGQGDWSRADLERAVESGTTRTVTLARRVPVLLAYWTAWVDRSRELQFRRDIYGRDAKVLAALGERFRFRSP